MSTFEPWPKIPRWNRPVVVTEKIDGTNGAIIIEKHPFGTADMLVRNTWDGLIGDGPVVTVQQNPFLLAVVDVAFEGADIMGEYHIYAQSRTRLVRPGTGREAGNDNYGFAAWVQERAEALVKLLGPGRHFGEFYGQGIARNYGLDHRRFALFNTRRWNDEDRHGLFGRQFQLAEGLEVDVVPALAQWGSPGDEVIERALDHLRDYGSVLVPGFRKPEGIVLYHTAAGQTFKILLEGDELPKGVVPRLERQLEAELLGIGA